MSESSEYNEELYRLKRCDTNVHALEERYHEEHDNGVHLLGGEVVSSAELQSDDEVQQEFSSIDKPDNRNLKKKKKQKAPFHRSSSSSKHLTIIILKLKSKPIHISNVLLVNN